MLKKYKKILSILLTLTFVSSTIFTKTVFASTESILKADNKTNFKFISTDPDNTEYTYEEDGKQYKVLETSNENLDNIHTEIFVKDSNNEYILIEKYDTVISMNEDNNIEVTKTENGINTTDILTLEETSINEPTVNSNLSRGIIGPDGTGSWEVVRSYQGNEYFTNFTYSVIVGILVSIVAAGLGLGAIASSIVGTVASAILNERIPTVYFKRTISYYREDNNMVTKVESYNNFYHDSSYRYYIGNATKTWTGKFPW